MLLSLQFSSLGKEHVGTGAAGSGVAAHYCRLGVFLSVDFSLGKSIVATESFTIIFLCSEDGKFAANQRDFDIGVH